MDFAKDCVRTWLKCLLGELFVTVVIGLGVGAIALSFGVIAMILER